jgi:hypothetical protein
MTTLVVVAIEAGTENDLVYDLANNWPNLTDEQFTVQGTEAQLVKMFAEMLGNLSDEVKQEILEHPDEFFDLIGQGIGPL